MTIREASTHKRAVAEREHAANGRSPNSTESLIEEAEEILGRYLEPGKLPRASVAQAFRSRGDLELVLNLYEQAMEGDPQEPAHPWNLASSLDRLGVSDLAVAYMRRAIRIAAEIGDMAWAGADAYLALADIAIGAGDPEIAALAIDHARRLDPRAAVSRYQRRLRRQLGQDDETPLSDLDSARKGTAVEHLIAATCMLASNFELNVSTSLVDDEGVDLVFHRRSRSTMLGVQIKSRSWAASTMRTKQRFVAQVRSRTFKPRPDLFLLFVAVDTRAADFGPVWLIPSQRFAEARNTPGRQRFRFSASAAQFTDDQWVRYRLEREELHEHLLNELKTLETRG